ncbi:tRNA preQ1(34) S-adenosylmethionine ribosyltransferase-isomerase QueA [bacterium endosymbiont of Bathymodiolus sp. 5 South]|jgi:S-adenosylmethionine:tRNA ribosyltransferase-isomerase|uniref:tRNA preQ1(34) S-adenosylmethionine ribosyltransferase-isomerase QueA n=1 Tax=bacterium endosymbiont of Bathymodiolus sp. 5 South TaxID=1181670 RepID=UPI0010B97F86|nr:tRNA preQ1(34) S-adenosylmethionine ribosyltransferase-isomerase QueA [bacterium endosymbiont of Bathymodiolus sp. 5 South]CAC9635526.1 S-adenosylmethionine:tRNA ribosyltransferase-isomerase (EC 2.4.99.17) [uncultured Gammaproteobacteria bacterium]CAC9657976.1 S-adenosylmethionine:tRNA ribosyltransferase-isomerase (EC 2.4.99.17) [uncultured Gammaproteobacteria bacterium]SHN91426.1 S-adenosylmethionine:tRNA ribosyltransferase-isomerase [bacterium endosymbiont of Bathymodiolus sp. 5 South]SSC0
MQLSDFDFDLPKSLIAQHPSKNRTDSRLLIAQSNLIDAQFHQIGDFIQSGDLLVMNNTKVIPARLFGHKDSGGKVEIMIERLLNDKQVLAMIRASRAPQIGSKITLENSEKASVLNKQDGFYTLEFATDSLLALLDNIGHIPLPPYIERTDDEQDLSRYQTVYAKHDGAVAAPTAGLHFDDALLNSLKDQGIDSAFVTLHVGAGTFQPVKTDNIKDHTMHSEYYEISQDSVDKINQTKANGGRIIAIGTTAVRSLESAAKSGILKATREETDIFIYPGYEFKVVDMMVTNFHLPKSSLLMLVSAFIGRERMMEIYQHAITQKYRFFSYGDAMLLTGKK